MKKSLRAGPALSALTVLGGCVPVPAYHLEPAPAVLVPAPVYYGPTLHFDIRSRHGAPRGRHHRGSGAPRGHR